MYEMKGKRKWKSVLWLFRYESEKRKAFRICFFQLIYIYLRNEKNAVNTPNNYIEGS